MKGTPDLSPSSSSATTSPPPHVEFYTRTNPSTTQADTPDPGRVHAATDGCDAGDGRQAVAAEYGSHGAGQHAGAESTASEWRETGEEGEGGRGLAVGVAVLNPVWEGPSHLEARSVRWRPRRPAFLDSEESESWHLRWFERMSLLLWFHKVREPPFNVKIASSYVILILNLNLKLRPCSQRNRILMEKGRNCRERGQTTRTEGKASRRQYGGKADGRFKNLYPSEGGAEHPMQL
ncbi:hypothetical protein BC830DRAFT_1079072 [Chytriomyces sp. MP71]|nr:hypothetical protein BC830DRAFT_1079072 [Chytriomyces sp. MP71]